MIESLCLYLLCLSAALLCYSGFQNYSLIRSTSCSCSTCSFGFSDFTIKNLQDFIQIYRALIKDIFLFVRVPRLHPVLPWGPPVVSGCAGVVVGWVCPPPPLWCFSLGGGTVACRVVALWCWSLAVPVLGLMVSVPPSPLARAAPSCFFSFCPSVVCVGVFGVSLLPSGRCSWFGVAGFWLGGPPVPFQGVSSSLPSGLGFRPPFVACVGGFVAVGLSRAPPLCFFFRGGVCLFLPLPSLGWCTHWSAFGVVFRVAFGVWVLPGLAPVQWVGSVMYTLGLAALPAGLGSGSAGWAVAPGGFMKLWVRGGGVFRIPSPPRCRF